MMASSLALFETFERSVRAGPGRLLLRGAGAGAQDLTASALLSLVSSSAADLGAAGVGPGQVVLLERAGGAPFVIGMLAIWARDAVALPADAPTADGELQQMRAAFAPDWTIAADGGGKLLARRETERGPRGRIDLPAGTCVIKVTSGTMGRPRGIATTAGQILADARHIVEGMRVDPCDTNVGAIPLSHSYGMASLLMPLVLQGSPLLLVPSALPDPLAAALSIDEPAVFPGVPYLFEMLARPGAPAVTRRGLKCCISAGALLRPQIASAFRDRCGLPVRAFYGASETGGIAFDASPEADAAIHAEGCVGTPLPGVEVDLEASPDEPGRPAGTGAEGRVVVRGENVASGYVGAGAGSARDESGGASADGAFRRGAFLTGDTGRMIASDGRLELHLTGRVAGFVNVSGRKVNPREVERALMEVPGVRDAAALGVSDASRGESIVACVAADAGVTREAALAHLRRALAAHKIPRRLVFLPRLPRTERGKLDMEALRRMAEGETPQ